MGTAKLIAERHGPVNEKLDLAQVEGSYKDLAKQATNLANAAKELNSLLRKYGRQGLKVKDVEIESARDVYNDEMEPPSVNVEIDAPWQVASDFYDEVQRMRNRDNISSDLEDRADMAMSRGGEGKPISFFVNLVG